MVTGATMEGMVVNRTMLRRQVEDTLEAAMAEMAPPVRGRGRPPIIEEALLWAAMLVSILEGDPSQRAIWRRVTGDGVWDHAPVAVTREAVRKRLVSTGPVIMERLFTQVTALLSTSFAGDQSLARFATEVYAMDASTLDAVAKRPPGATDRPLAGRLHALFDLRRQLYTRIELTEHARANERTTVPALLADLPPGCLLVMDRGYTSFALFDAIVTQGHQFVTRYDKTFAVTHPLTATETVTDELGFCGAHRADRAGQLMRRITLTLPSGQTRRYLTSVLDPAIFPPAAVAALYARRWDIELAFKLLKRVLRLDRPWSTSWAMNQVQIWATLLIAQIVSTLRQEIARRGNVDLFDVSVEILLKDLHHYVARGDPDIIGALVARAPYGGIIRPHRRITIVVSTDLPVTPPPADLPTIRPRRYAGKA